MLKLWKTTGRWALVGSLLVCLVQPVGAAEEEQKPCEPVETKKVKIEGYINREHTREKRQIIKEFVEIGHTEARIRPFPMGKTAKVVAVGRCVPAYIARHVLNTSLKYTEGIESLVNQAFLHSHWIGIATTIFDEPSQQTVTPEQVEQLLNPDLGDDEFHALYQKFSIQDDTVPFLGQRKENVKKVD
ncbi:hypothetical protein [Nitrospina watsonii]|uniref:hypothetical protein n=1 Tax=Nitrospina watsonii TaxID=1323948 RepID=UPI0024935F55|nr:hypothetical protein [Nitrospina watsonii]